eukprot:CAMPEP_0204906728 /NCGR_PEP_ID=MMETSP1397-20131031/6128_1 /ASSEMBLY_ACC=CAM_ASM_000891 /TAXON_ID=49980 /ORGANISM="Climacostomum Climacostomum virens, Strain Stock W-24" /LENGTH=232 /DNA_ID=CAMNT_0052075731 /DNA_START=986 /DNA_END=1684 /DNA_ORIENTATION=-
MAGSEALIAFTDDSDRANLKNGEKFELQRGADDTNVTMITLHDCSSGCTLEFAEDLSINGTVTTNVTQDLILNDVKQWKLVEIEDFQGSVKGWSQEYISSCGNSPDLFLGGYCKLASDAVSKSFTLPTHEYINIRFNLHFFDKWVGETIQLKIDGTKSWSASHKTCDTILSWTCNRYGINACGDDSPDRLGFFGEHTKPHTSTTLDIEFSSTLDRSSCEVSWGLDNVEIYVR